MGKKIREAQVQKINYIVTIGDKEVKNKKLAVRSHTGEIKFGVSVNKFIKDLLREIEKKEIK
jgi:threonyl-tRNA synthetase